MFGGKFYFLYVTFIINRRVGDAYQWNANTLTFYNGENFTGAKEISFGDNNKRTLNLKKTEVPNPR